MRKKCKARRVVAVASNARALSLEEAMDLIGVGLAFTSDGERRAAWERHRERLIAGRSPMVRPKAFWDYEGPSELRGRRTPELEAQRRAWLQGPGAEHLRAGELQAYAVLWSTPA